MLKKLTSTSILAITLLASTGQVIANPSVSNSSAAQCQTLSCVRSNIDTIDQQIIQLIGERLQLVKRAGELKSGNAPVHDQARENAILTAVGIQASKNGYPPSIAQAVFKTILQQSNQFEAQYDAPPK